MENKHIKYVGRYFTVERVIGKGAFGQVLVTSTGGGNKYTRYATKCILPVQRPLRLASELRYLRDLGGQCNVVRLHTAHLHEGSLYIVMDMIEPDPFEQLVCSFSHDEICTYIRKLLEALKHIHSHNIMHRDIKPHNFLHNRARGQYLLVDFGLATQVRVRPPVNPIAFSGASGTPVGKGAAGVGDQQPPTTPKRTSVIITGANHQSLTATANRHFTGANLFGESGRPTVITNIADTPFVNPARMQSPAKRMNFGSPLPHNISSKRLHHTNDANDSMQKSFKRLRVSNINNNIVESNHHAQHETPKEPIKLTVNHFESPVTASDNQDKSFSLPRSPPWCSCRGKPRTCSTCLSKPESPAARSGTASYKAPEILLHYVEQKTPIDIWAAGVILFCLLAGHQPLFRDRDDSLLVAEIITLLGSKAVREAARAMRIRLTVFSEFPGYNLKELCSNIRAASKDARKDVVIPDAAYHLLARMLDPNPKTRITANDALNHPWISGGGTDSDRPPELSNQS